jgi:two-component system sensor histidine kinase VicK
VSKIEEKKHKQQKEHQEDEKCPLCGQSFIGDKEAAPIIHETIDGTTYGFDREDCAVMFKRFLSVYGDSFKEFSGQPQYISDSFWDKVLPKEQEIIEIQEDDQEAEKARRDGKTVSQIKVISSPSEVQELGFSLIRSAKEDADIIVSTCNAFHRQLRVGALDLLGEVRRANNNLNIRILTPADDKIRNEISPQLKERFGIDVRFIAESLESRISLLVVDRKSSLAIELKDDTKDSSEEAIGLGIYSNHRSTVLSYVTVFETLWKELELKEKVSRLCEQLKTQENMQKEFINVAAHEFRAPIQPILGLAEILRSRQTVDFQKQDELLTVIIRNARRLKTLTENILDLSRIENKSLRLHKEVTNIDGIVVDVIQDIKSQMGNEKIRDVTIMYISKRGPKNGNNEILLEVDKGRLSQVISNLLDNAIKFTEGKGTVTIGLERRLDANKNELVVYVKDTGIGIDSEIMPSLFTKFKTRGGRGTGLGLYISKSIVEAHGGRIWAENNEGSKGATFSFSLPVR